MGERERGRKGGREGGRSEGGEGGGWKEAAREGGREGWKGGREEGSVRSHVFFCLVAAKRLCSWVGKNFANRPGPATRFSTVIRPKKRLQNPPPAGPSPAKPKIDDGTTFWGHPSRKLTTVQHFWASWLQSEKLSQN